MTSICHYKYSMYLILVRETPTKEPVTHTRFSDRSAYYFYYSVYMFYKKMSSNNSIPF